MKRLSIVIFSIIFILVLLIGAVFIVPGLVPTDAYRDKLESELSQTLGRDVKVTGDIKISTFPVVKIATGPVSLANPDGFSDKNFADVQAMTANVKLWPLLSKQVVISGVTFDTPNIRLEKRADGAMNWALSSDDESAEPKEDTGPYKRDGRFTEYDPALDLLQISNGTISYVDAATGRELNAEAINIDLRAPSLSKPVKLKGDLTIDGLATSLDASLTSPLDFLSGKATNFNAKINTDEGDIETSGAFKPGEAIAFDASFDTDINAPMRLVKRLPLPKTVKIPDLTNLEAKGDISFGPNLTRLPKLTFAAAGPGLSVDYSGAVDASDGVIAKGDFKAKLDDMSIVAPYLETPIEALDLVKAVEAKGNMDWNGSRLTLSALNGSVDGTQLSAKFNGNASYENTLALSGDFDAQADDVSVITPYLKDPIDALNAVKTVTAKGKIDWDGTRLTLDTLDSFLSGPQLKATFKGSGNYTESLALNGTFTGETADLDALLKTAGISQADAAAVKRIKTNGTLALQNNSQVTMTDFAATASEGYVNGQYAGQIGYDNALTLNGQISADIPDLGALNAALPREIPYADITKRVEFSSQIANQGTGFALSGLNAALEGGLLTGDFNGRLATGNQSDISGNLNIASSSLRAIARTQDVDLPASTDAGPIFEAFKIAGQVSGTPNRINFTNGNLGLDALSGNGDFSLQLGEGKPNLTGTLALGTLDVRPYMAAWSAQNPTGQIMPWATTPIDLAALNSVNSEIALTTPGLITDRLQFGKMDTNVRIQNGTLTTNISKAQLYNGQVDGSFALGVSTGVPSLSMRTNVRSVDALDFLKATSGFEKVTGTADLTMSITGSGSSQDAIMKSLAGSGTFNVKNGQLLGIDASNLLSGVDQAVASRQLPLGAASGIGGTTDFNDLDGSFDVYQGRADVKKFQVQSRALFMDAEGVIDIGNQNIDFRMRPMLSEGSNVAQFGIPIRFSGKFGQAKPGLDSGFLGQIVEAKARDKASSLVKEQVGGQLGGLLGSVIGGNTSTEPSDGTTETSPSPFPQFPETTTETDKTPSPSEPETTSPEDQIEDALKDLFGKKKKKN